MLFLIKLHYRRSKKQEKVIHDHILRETTIFKLVYSHLVSFCYAYLLHNCTQQSNTVLYNFAFNFMSEASIHSPCLILRTDKDFLPCQVKLVGDWYLPTHLS